MGGPKGEDALSKNEEAGGPPDRAKIEEVFRRHGMTVAEPEPFK